MAFEVEATSNIDGWRVVNETGLPDTVITENASMKEIASKLSRWVDAARGGSSRSSMFDRGIFMPPDNPYDEMRAAKHALETDDIVSGVAEITEAFAFQGVKWEDEEADEADVFNQWARDVNLDQYLRQVWREEYAQAQSVTAMVWGWRTYKVRGRGKPPELKLEKHVDPTTGVVSYVEPRDPETNQPMKRPKGQKRKKSYRVWVPIQLSVLDHTQIVPVGVGPLGSTKLAWCSTNATTEYWNRAKVGEVIDPMLTTLLTDKYEPDQFEAASLAALGVDVENLLLMNPALTFRHTMTKSDYERFAHVRLKSVFGLLDMKRQLIASDRAALVGAANYILLIRKGDKDMPGTQAEVDALHQNYNFIAKMPVIISDHRLSIEIIAPKTDLTLQSEKYDVLDTRILARLLGTLSLGGRGQRNETNVTLSRAVAKAMENRRHMLKRTLEREIARAIVEHPNNAGVFEGEPNLVFTPRNIALDIDQAMVQAMLSLRTQRELSRETILEQFGFDQGTEAQRMELEEEIYDEIFKTAIPFNGQPGDMPPSSQATGAQGGRPAGGGAPTANATKATPKTPAGNSPAKRSPK